MKASNNKLERNKVKVVKNNKRRCKTSKKKNYHSESSEWLEDDGIDYEENLNKRKKLEIELQKEKELICAEHDKLNRKSVCSEVRFDALVEQLKDKHCRVVLRIKRKNIQKQKTQEKKLTTNLNWVQDVNILPNAWNMQQMNVFTCVEYLTDNIFIAIAIKARIRKRYLTKDKDVEHTAIGFS